VLLGAIDKMRFSLVTGTGGSMKIRYSALLKKRLPMALMDLAQTRRVMERRERSASWEAELERIKTERRGADTDLRDPQKIKV
jgi:hypothetical protein